MGQYYNVVIKNKNTITTYNKKVDGEYTPAKLTEHSWWLNPFVCSLTKLLYENLTPCRVAWVGDYAYSADGLNIPDGIDVAKLHEIAWGENSKTQEIHKDELYLDGKYLVNHTKKIYLNCDDYKLRSNDYGWVIHPLPLLTAIGNGLGGGDYYGINKDQVGGWAWCAISVEDDIPVGYKELKCTFRED
jgi:hypothetical protein